MNPIQIQKINVKPTTHKWVSGKGTVYEYDNPMKEYEVISRKDFTQFVNEVKENDLMKLQKFDETKKVFFHSSVTFSRSKFRELFPKTKVTYSIENADCIIIDKQNYLRPLSYYYHSLYCYPGLNTTGDPANDFYSNDESSPFVDKSKPSSERKEFLIVEEKAGKKTNMNAETINFMNLIISGTKELVDVDTIALKSELVIDEFTFTQLHQLLKSNIPQNMQLACSMLSGYDYEQSHSRMALLLKLNWTNWDQYREKKTFIDLKTILNRLYKDYPNIASYNYNEHAFWYSLFSKYSDDNIIHAYFHDWLNTQMACSENNVELLLRIKGKDDTFVFDTSSHIPVEERIRILNEKNNGMENNAEGGIEEPVEVPVSEGLPF